MGDLCLLDQEPLILSLVLEHHHERRSYHRFDQLQLEGEQGA